MEYTREQAEKVFADWYEFIGISSDLSEPNLDFLDHKFPKLEVGKWYWLDNGSKRELLICQQNSHYAFGFGVDGKFYDEMGNIGTHQKYRPATDKEVEEALKAEAKRRGYKEGVVIDNSNLGFSEVPWTLSKSSWYNGSEFVFRELGLDYANSATIFKDGKWAEIIEEPKEVELTLDEVAEKFGVDVKHLKIKK